jgi:hypothetical protein
VAALFRASRMMSSTTPHDGGFCVIDPPFDVRAFAIRAEHVYVVISERATTSDVPAFACITSRRRFAGVPSLARVHPRMR